MSTITDVDFVGVPTADLEAAAAFYGDTLGLKRDVYVPDRNYAEFDINGLTLSVYNPVAMGMEHKKLKQTPQAVEWFKKTLEKDPGYCVAYHQAALAYEDSGEVELARATYREGISVARKKGDNHAAEEMEAALSMIE